MGGDGRGHGVGEETEQDAKKNRKSSKDSKEACQGHRDLEKQGTLSTRRAEQEDEERSNRMERSRRRN